MKIGLTSDTPSAKWCWVSEIGDELHAYEKEVLLKYTNKLSFELWVGFRCLPKAYEWKPKRRFYKDENALGMDLLIEEETIRPFTDGRYHSLSKDEQRLIMGEIFYNFLIETFKRYKNKVPGIAKYGEELIKDTHIWAIKNKWLEM